MNGEIWPLAIDEPVKFKKWPVKVLDFKIFSNHLLKKKLRICLKIKLDRSVASPIGYMLTYFGFLNLHNIIQRHDNVLRDWQYFTEYFSHLDRMYVNMEPIGLATLKSRLILLKTSPDTDWKCEVTEVSLIIRYHHMNNDNVGPYTFTFDFNNTMYQRSLF
jgi:hypothetical protein